MNVQVNAILQFRTTTCITCGCIISMPEELYDRRLSDRRDFYCPNGHSQHFIEETEAVRLKRELEVAQRRLQFERSAKENAEAALTKAKAGQVRLKRRIAAGVCPCCHRTVQQLARHMTQQHPDYGKDEATSHD